MARGMSASAVAVTDLMGVCAAGQFVQKPARWDFPMLVPRFRPLLVFN